MRNPLDESLKINVRLFRRIQRMILKHPSAFNMATFDGKDTVGYSGNDKVMAYDPATMKEPDCGSACCIAGWTVILGNNEPLTVQELEGYDIAEEARRLLGLTDSQASKIFHYQGSFDRIGLVTAKAASEMIDRFLANPAAPIK